MHYGYIAYENILENKIPRYVGIGKTSNRWKHLISGRSHNKVINFYHKNNKELVVEHFVFDNKNEAIEWEISKIKEYGRKDQDRGTLFNHTDGGDGNNDPQTWRIGLTMKQVTKNPNWVSPNTGRKCPHTSILQKGKTMSERLGREFISPKRGKKMIDYRGKDYIHPLKGISRKEINTKIHCIPVTLENIKTGEIKTWNSSKECKEETGAAYWTLIGKNKCKRSKDWKLPGTEIIYKRVGRPKGSKNKLKETHQLTLNN